ncbi:MAG: UMP kinase [Candidatus Doudnabacteria bacterium CG10_big_fil_rev_8_21_14_0_10_42_18]|uniref:UMP kinase n=1 Tax=Candidatus Doudnabacteria bacterium CG10_big_fil_rev_8_21_14_0_10_42_18 TaxID=1974552 RepID=A0A2H0VD84_9BACT|nr:MAG: UMP kinase [Candidatus Doudnabacteria bacterium CG10_big_fil_rev_8_21_14_0_10_42_18]
MKKTFVISLGGSLVIPNEIDIKFLRGFKSVILKQVRRGNKFILIVGGGKVCRKYQTALAKISKVDAQALDWMGINSTWLNAKLVQLIFEKYAYSEIAKDPQKKIVFKEPILVGGGWKPGRSSDGAMVKYATAYKTSTIINLSNIAYVYDKDPRKFKDAKKQEKLSWNELLKITGRKWVPGKNVPFDPIATKFAQKNKLKVIVANGKDLKNLENLLNGQKFKGSTVG